MMRPSDPRCLEDVEHIFSLFGASLILPLAERIPFEHYFDPPHQPEDLLVAGSEVERLRLQNIVGS